MSSTGTLPAVEQSTYVDASPDHAFEVFTERIESWWPLGTHSIFEGESDTVVFEARVGGRIYERTPDGREGDWGEVLELEAPRRIVYSWHPGHDPSEGVTEVEIRFDPEGDGTRVSIVHSGWERLGERGAKTREMYTTPDAWEGVLELYRLKASS